MAHIKAKKVLRYQNKPTYTINDNPVKFFKEVLEVKMITQFFLLALCMMMAIPANAVDPRAREGWHWQVPFDLTQPPNYNPYYELQWGVYKAYDASWAALTKRINANKDLVSAVNGSGGCIQETGGISGTIDVYRLRYAGGLTATKANKVVGFKMTGYSPSAKSHILEVCGFPLGAVGIQMRVPQ